MDTAEKTLRSAGLGQKGMQAHIASAQSVFDTHYLLQVRYGNYMAIWTQIG